MSQYRRGPPERFSELQYTWAETRPDSRRAFYRPRGSVELHAYGLFDSTPLRSIAYIPISRPSRPFSSKPRNGRASEALVPKRVRASTERSHGGRTPSTGATSWVSLQGQLSELGVQTAVNPDFRRGLYSPRPAGDGNYAMAFGASWAPVSRLWHDVSHRNGALSSPRPAFPIAPSWLQLGVFASDGIQDQYFTQVAPNLQLLSKFGWMRKLDPSPIASGSKFLTR